MTLFQKRLKTALDTALAGQVAIVIVPRGFPKAEALNHMIRDLVPEKYRPLVRATDDALHFEGLRGSVRIYPEDHATYDRKQERLLDYPHGTLTLLHPEVAP